MPELSPAENVSQARLSSSLWTFRKRRPQEALRPRLRFRLLFARRALDVILTDSHKNAMREC
jgi:hypothetical protein